MFQTRSFECTAEYQPLIDPSDRKQEVPCGSLVHAQASVPMVSLFSVLLTAYILICSN